MITLDQLKKTHQEFCDSARDIIYKKGADYNREQQLTGDTLFNMRAAKILGITNTNTQGVLVRLQDKMMRLISLTKNPKTEAQVKDESVADTVKDTINYVIYLYMLWEEEKDE